MKLKRLWIILICFGMVLGGNVLHAAHFSSKKAICQIQMDLQSLGYYHGKITGILDKDTREATKAFQKEHGLKADGIPGKKTRRALKKALKAKTSMKGQKNLHSNQVKKEAKNEREEEGC